MAAPSIISFLITSIYSLADTYFVSSLGTNATAAVSVNASLDQIIMMAGSMLAVGAASYISRLLGARKEERASRVFSVAFFTAMAFGAAVMVLGLSFMGPMVRLLGATDTCEQYAMEYASYVLLAAPFMAANFVMNQCLRAEGSAMLSMIGMGFGGVLNCFLDPFFIFYLDMGVAGASIATAISKLVSFAILIFPYLARRSLLRLSPRLFRPDGDILGQIVSVGSSSLFRNGLAVVSAIVLNRIAGSISDSALAGIGVSTKVMMFPFGVILGFGTGFQPVAGFNWGAKRYDRVEESYRFAARNTPWGKQWGENKSPAGLWPAAPRRRRAPAPRRAYLPPPPSCGPAGPDTAAGCTARPAAAFPGPLWQRARSEAPRTGPAAAPWPPPRSPLSGRGRPAPRRLNPRPCGPHRFFLLSSSKRGSYRPCGAANFRSYGYLI